MHEYRDVDPDPGQLNVEGVRELLDNDSTFGFAWEHGFTESFTGYFHAEFAFAIDEAGDDVTVDKAYAGVRGGFGAVQIGDWDGIYFTHVDGLMDVLEYGATTLSEGFRTPTGNARVDQSSGARGQRPEQPHRARRRNPCVSGAHVTGRS